MYNQMQQCSKSCHSAKSHSKRNNPHVFNGRISKHPFVVVYFEDNLKNTLFDQDDGEDDRQAYRRGESVYDKLHESLVNIKDILMKKNEIIEFLNRCEKTKEYLKYKKMN